MSWSIFVKASKRIVLQRVAAARCSGGFPEEEKRQFELAQTVILAEIGNIPDMDAVNVEATGSMNVVAAEVNPETQEVTKPRKIAWSQVKIVVEPIRIEGMVPGSEVAQPASTS
jgi:hypothetical protein